MSQFSSDDERAGHRLMLDRIRTEQIKHEPEPDHDPECSRYPLKAWGSLQTLDTFETWCCEWHQYHSQEDK